jgi:hypothetical protein
MYRSNLTEEWQENAQIHWLQVMGVKNRLETVRTKTLTYDLFPCRQSEFYLMSCFTTSEPQTFEAYSVEEASEAKGRRYCPSGRNGERHDADTVVKAMNFHGGRMMPRAEGL